MSLFIELRKQGKLAAKRNPMYEKNKFGKFWMYFMAVFWAGYLIFFGTTFAFAFDGGATEAYHVLRPGGSVRGAPLPLERPVARDGVCPQLEVEPGDAEVDRRTRARARAWSGR